MDKARLAPAVGAGFTLIAQRPGSVLVWGLVYLFLSIAPVLLLLAASAQELIVGYKEMLAHPDAMAAGPPAAFAKLRGLQGVQLLCGLVVVAFVHTAIFRAVLRPEQSSFFFLRCGMAELRVAGVAAVLYIFMILAMLALVIACGIPAIAVVAASGGQPSPVATTVLVLLGCAAVIALLPVGARLAMALPMTVAQDRFRLFEAWPLTKGYGWKLAGVFILVVLIVLGLEVLVLVLGAIAVAAMTGGFDPEAMTAMFSLEGGVARVAALIAFASLLYIALISIILPITVAPWARAYQLIDQTTATTASTTFE